MFCLKAVPVLCRFLVALLRDTYSNSMTTSPTQVLYLLSITSWLSGFSIHRVDINVDVRS